MNTENIEERLQSIEDTLDTLVERQKETTDVVQGYLDNLANLIRDAEESICQATVVAAERLTGEPECRDEIKEALGAISEKLKVLQAGTVTKAKVVNDEKDGLTEIGESRG
ncbi:MAG: hypothetical protein KBD21_04210 [Candidatus Pacebacteria bacterium]|nr:hypothetical protein [Candidatus Paceibacterota bacterium]